MKLKRPILIGGLGLSASLWLLDIVGHSPLADGSGVLGAVALGSGLWWLKQRTSPAVEIAPPLALGPVDKPAIEKVLAQAASRLETLITELPEAVKADKTQPIWLAIEQQRQAAVQALAQLDRKSIAIAIIGNKATGKTALLSQLNETWKSSESQSLSEVTIIEVSGEETLPPAETDLVLLMTAGDLMHSELQRLQSLLKFGYRVQLVFNKQDQLAPLDRQSVVQRLQTRVQDLGIGVSAISAQPNPVKVRRHQENGQIEESFEQPNPQIESLTTQLTHWVKAEAEQLVMTTTLRQAKTLLASAQNLLNQQRRQRAMPLVEQMQWLAAGSAFASPLPSLDLLASAAINAQMIVDLGALYGQAFSLAQAKTAAGTLAELLVKLGLVEISTQALGSLLKTHVATYVAGGALQGVSAAYLTRMVGLSLIDFFEEQSLLAPEQRKFAFADMGSRLQTLFQATKQTAGLQAFMQQALSHLPIPSSGWTQAEPQRINAAINAA